MLFLPKPKHQDIVPKELAFVNSLQIKLQIISAVYLLLFSRSSYLLPEASSYR
jgi:hypothetical protein